LDALLNVALERGLSYFIAVTLLVAAGWFVRWILTEIVKPGRDRAFAHLDATNQAMTKLTDTLSQISDGIAIQTSHVDEKRTQIHNDLEHMSGKIDTVQADVTVIKNHVIGNIKRESLG
jgi:hypothetical protein